jgi:hypothetical protein
VQLARLAISVYGWTGLVLIVCFALGYPVARCVSTRRAVRMPLAVVAGAGVLSSAVCLLSWVHLFTRGAVVVVVALGASGTIYAIWKDWATTSHSTVDGESEGLDSRYFLLLGVALSAAVILTLYPVPLSDATLSHLPLAQSLVEHRGFVYEPFIRFSFAPQGPQAVFAVVQLLTDDSRVVQALQLSLIASALWLVAAWFSSRGMRAGGLVAGLVLLANPAVFRYSAAALTDPWLIVFTIAAITVAVDTLESSRPKALFGWALTGFFLGQAAAAKYQGLFVAASFFLIALLAARRRVSWVPLVLGLGISAGPWYLRTLLLSGSPIYPALSGLFGNPKELWTAREIEYLHAAANRGLGSGLSGFVNRLLRNARIITGATGEDFSATIPAYGSLTLGAGLGLALERVRRDPRYQLSLGTGVGCLAMWMVSSSVARYAMAGVAALTMASGFVGHEVWRNMSSAITRKWRWVAWCGIAALLLAPTSVYFLHVLRTQGLPRSDARWVREGYVARGLCYTGIEYLNKRFGKDYSAYGANCEHVSFFAEGDYKGDWFGPGGYFRVLGDPSRPAAAPERLSKRLRELDVEYVLFHTHQVPDPTGLVRSQEFRLVFEDAATLVFRVLPES